MLEKKIQLKAFSEVKEFVKAAEKCEYDVDVFYNRVVVDAKSILGVMSMDLTRPLTVKYHVEDQDCFEQTLNKFAM
ncbi:MAG: HPr family phosphocarrier protein [Lachnospiraceae bacterium]|nr:HPr family phosphocarrier protein [Lachnospiraceae bacterium]MDO5807951.1 HPr family phosphocarrier protein [Lachnospiraceae bacterium]